MNMKKLFCLLVLVLCSCRNLPDEYYENTVYADSAIDEVIEVDYSPNNLVIGKVGIKIKELNVGADENFLWTAPSVLTLGVLNTLGYPAYRHVRAYYVVGAVFDINGNVADVYSTIGEGSVWSGCYYGYSLEDGYKLAGYQARKNGIDNLMKEIYKDENLYKAAKVAAKNKIMQLKKAEEKKKADIKKKAENEKRKTAEKKQHLKNVLDEVDDI